MFKKLNNKRGFSLVELMVVVAIMGTLASIAIPAFNSYRKSAKKAAYKSDLTSLHKGLQAFGVELDSYCERETLPDDFSISNVGMQSLLTSKLYGNNSATATNANCDVSGTLTPANLRPTSCSPSGGANPCSTCSSGSFTPYIPAGNGPGKDNFIGFEDASTNCSNITANVDSIHRLKASNSAMPAGCDLNISAYSLGVAGHISGNDYIGFDINNNGVVDETAENPYTTVVGASGVCT